MKLSESALTGLAAVWCLTLPLAAAEVELRSPDGFVSFTGEILEIKDNMITLNSGNGVVNIPMSAVECFGDACPDTLAKGAVVLAQPEAGSSIPAELSFEVAFDRNENVQILGRSLLSSQSTRPELSVSFPNTQTVRIASKDLSAVRTLRLVGGPVGQTPVAIQSRVAALSGVATIDTPSAWANQNAAISQELNNEAFAVLNSLATGVDSLSLTDLAAIFSGEITNWAQIGGNNIDILPMQTAPGSSTHSALRQTILAPFSKTASSNIVTAPDEMTLLTTMGIAPGAVALVSLEALGDRQPVDIIDACQQPSSPTAFEIASGRYPLSVTTYAKLASDAREPGLSSILDEVALAEPRQGLLAEARFRAERMNGILNAVLPEEMKAPARKLVQSIIEADRLAMTFTDAPVSEVVGARSRADFAQLADAVRKGDFDGQEIMFLGFAADQTNPSSALASSKAAATTLLAAFQEFAPDAATRPGVTFFSEGHGFVGYSDCKPQGLGSAPTFIEIWVRPAA